MTIDNSGPPARLHCFFLTLLWMCVCSCSQAGNSDAIKLIEDYWTGDVDALPIGEVQIVRPNPVVGLRPNLSKGQTSPDDLHAYEVLRQQNEIVISSDIDLASNKNFSWQNYGLSLNGVSRILTVATVVPQDERLRCPEAVLKRVGTKNLICIATGSGSVQEIVRSQKFQIGTAKYWLIMGNHRWKWSDTERKIREQQGKAVTEEMKFMAIAKYEDFAKKWQVAMADYAPRTGQFSNQQQFDDVLRQAAITDKQQ